MFVKLPSRFSLSLTYHNLGSTLHLRYLHGKEFFALLNSPNPSAKTLNFERFARLGFVTGIPEDYIAHRLRELGADTYDPLDFEMFNVCYFDLLCKLDNYSRRQHGITDGDTGPEGKRCTIS